MTHNTMNNSLQPLGKGERHQTYRRTARQQRDGFTLIEVMVALAILMVMLVIMFVPINLGVSLTQIGRTRADVQQTSQLTINRLESELRQAMIVFPNDAMPGITDKAPYSSTGLPEKPYYQVPEEVINDTFANNPSTGACGPINIIPKTVKRVSNTSRIDFILPKRDNAGNIITPLVPDDFVITYYARRLNPDAIYDPTGNPVELFRAETPVTQTRVTNAITAGADRYPTEGGLDCVANRNLLNKRALWLYQSQYGEPNLAIKDFNDNDGTHTMATPRDMGLITPLAASSEPASPTPTPYYTPSTSFICEDSNNDGKIDRVKISLTLAKFDSNGSSSAEQRIPLSTIVSLPNVR